MNITSSTSLPTNPYHIARAYGLPSARPPQAAQQAQAASGAKPVSAVKPVHELRVPAEVQPIQRIGGKGYSPELQSLVAGTVPGGVDFHADGTATPSGGADGHGGSLPFYRHPADRNAAATAVTVGRSLDISG